MSAKPRLKEEIQDFEIKFDFKCEEEAGASLDHNRITRNVGGLLWNYFRRIKCEVFTSDMPVFSQAKNDGKGGIYLPDIVVVCGDDRKVKECEIVIIDKDTSEERKIIKRALTKPHLIGEVWSDSNKIDDKKTKLRDYQQIESLREYITFEQYEYEICKYVKDDEGNWSEGEIIKGKDKFLKILGFNIDLKDIYEKTEIKQ